MTGGGRSSALSRRSAKRFLGIATSAIWKATWQPWLTTFAPILISFSFRLVSDQSLIGGTTLRYPYEVRDFKDYFYDIPDVKVAPDMLKLAEHILSSKEATFDPTLFVDRYEQAVLQLLEKSGRACRLLLCVRSLPRPPWSI